MPTAWQCLGPTASRQKAVEANPDEALREHVQAEAAEEFLSAERHQSDLTPVAVVLPPKRDLVVGRGDESMVGDCDPVGGPGEIVKHVVGPPNGGFRVDDPVVAKEGAKPYGEAALVGESLEVARQPEGPGAKGIPETGDDLAPKDPAQDLDREEEEWARVHPSRAVGREAARRHDAVHVRMVQQCLAPRVKDAEKAERGSEVLRRAGDLEERRRTRLKQQVVDDPFVL